MNKPIGILLMIVFLLCSHASAATATDMIGGEIEIAIDPTLHETYPKIAFNASRNEYLVVWWNDRPGCDDVQAQRLSSSGTLLEGPFFIAWAENCGTDPVNNRYPDVAYNSIHDEYLVVWEHEDEIIQGRRIHGSGELIGSEFVISAEDTDWQRRKPAVEYAFTSDRYMVVWESNNTSGTLTHAVFNQIITPDGQLEGVNLEVSISPDTLQEVDLAYNRHANRFLVVWQRNRGSSQWSVHGQQVHPTGTLYNPELTIYYTTVSSTQPSVAAIPTSPTDEKFLVVWESEYEPFNRSLLGKIVTEEGALADAIWIMYSTDDLTRPQVAGSEGRMKYLVTWGNANQPGVWGRFVSFNGMEQETVFNLGGANAPGNGGVAAGRSGDFLAVWDDDPWGDDNVYGRLIGNRLYLPLILR